MARDNGTAAWHPLSVAQRSRWFLYQLEPACQGRHNNTFAASVPDGLDIAALEGALGRLVERHPSLRTRYAVRDGEPAQQVCDASGVTVTQVDAHAMNGAELRLRVAADAGLPFDLAAGLLLRASVYRRARGESVLLLAFDHIAGDGWAYWLLLDELGTLLSGGDLAAAPARDYLDYAAWQRTWLAGEEAQAQKLYWESEVGADAAVLELPTDRPRSEQSGQRYATQTVMLDARLRDRLAATARRHGATLFSVLLAGYQILLHRYTGQDTIMVGAPMPGRTAPDWDAVVGDFVNPVVLKSEFAGRPSAADVIRATRRRALRGLSRQDYPFAALVDDLRPARTPGVHPLFQTAFVFQNARAAGELARLWEPSPQPVAWGGMTLSRFEFQRGYAQNDIDLALETLESDGGIVCEFSYDLSLFDDDTVATLARCFRTLLAEMALDDSRPAAVLPLLDGEQRTRILDGFDGPRSPWSPDLAHRQFEQQAAARPAALALIAGEDRIDYAELNRRANRLAHELLARGTRPDQLVAIHLERGVDMVTAILATLKSGAAYVPLDPVHPVERLAYMLADSRPHLLLTTTALRASQPGLAPAGTGVLCIDADPFAQRPDHNPDSAAFGLTPRHLAYVLYTSGSTGQPKGVMVEHANVGSLITYHLRSTGMCATDRALQFASFGFDSSVVEIFTALSAGACLVVRPAEMVVPDERFSRFLHDHGITAVDLPTAFWHAWALEVQAGRALPPPGLRLVVVGGEKAERRQLATWFDAPATRAVTWINTYGPTEATVYATAAAYCAAGDVPAGDLGIGRPIANSRIRILDALGQLLPVGVRGEIHIGGPGVARGYLNRPELTAERFIADPYSAEPHARLYRTGDLGHWLPDGSIAFDGRNDFQVKIRGMRIEPGEIEQGIAAYPGVRETVVLAAPDAAGHARLVAYVAMADGAVLDPAGLRRHLAERLAAHMVPEFYVAVAAFPLTPNGKIDRRALPPPDTHSGQENYEAPRGAVESAIAGIWQETLEIAKVGRHDHYFRLGGHSLLVIGMVERLRQAGLPVDVRMVYSSPTPALLAAALAVNQAAGQAPARPPEGIPADAVGIVPSMLPLVALTQEQIDSVAAGVPGGAANIQDIYPLSPLQEGLLFHYLLDGENDVYQSRAVIEFAARPALDAFLAALQTVVDRHDVLRTSFVWTGLPQPVQVVWRSARMDVVTLAAPADGDTLAYLLEVTDTRSSQIDLRRAPLLAPRIVREPAHGRWLLALTDHHIVSDHVTLERMLTEIDALLGGDAALDDPVPFRNFVTLARAVPQAEHEAYFRRELAGYDTPVTLFDQAPLLDPAAHVEKTSVQVAPDVAQRIRAQCTQWGVTPATLFHAAWAIVLARCSGQRDVVFGTTLAGRSHGVPGADRVLGLFINSLPVRFRLEQCTVAELVTQTSGRLSELVRHEQAPLALAQRCSDVPAGAPLFSTLFVFRHSTAEFGGHKAFRRAGMRVLSSGESSTYPVTAAVDDLGRHFGIDMHCAPGADAARMAAWLVEAADGLARALAAGGAAGVDTIGILSAQERARLVHAFNDTARPYPRTATLHGLFEEHAGRRPDARALVFEQESYTYGELNQRANRLAHRLRELGARPDARIGICAERSADFVVGMLAVLKAGACYLPLDPSAPPARLAHVLGEAAPIALLVQERTRALVMESGVPIIDLADASHAGRPAGNPEGGAHAAHLAYVIYTSGSTGLPKGVMIEHRHVLRLVLAQAYFTPTPRDTIAHCANPAFDATTWEVWSALAHGATLVVVAQEALLDPVRLEAVLTRHGVNVLHLTAGLFSQYAQPLAATYAGLDCLLFGGDQSDLAAVENVVRHSRPRKLVHCYGPTESTTFATTLVVDETALAGKRLSIGAPIGNTRIHILDAHMQPMPLGAAGEIHVGGDGVARGYLNRPDLTAERFVPDPFSAEPGARLYKTGDLGRWLPDGRIEYLGRNDFQVKIRGYRVEMGEIEARLATCPGVSESLVVAREDGPGEKRLVAYYLARQAPSLAPLSEEDGDARPSPPDAGLSRELHRQLAQSLPDYMVPSAFVRLERWPLTPNGKVDRRALPAPDAAARASRAYEAPVTALEQAVAAIWQEVLGVERIGRHDDFFDLGGHSLLAMQVVSRVGQGLGVEVALRDLFNHRDLAGFSAEVARAGRTDRAAIEPVPRTGPLPLSGAQQRLWFLDQLDGAAGAAYHMPAALRLRGPLDVAALQAALDRVVARHESLRTTFAASAGRPFQHVAGVDAGMRLRICDLRNDGQHEPASKLEAHLRDEAHRPFDLTAGPPIRATLLRLDGDDHVLLLTQHHIISDGWSVAVLTREVAALYGAFSQGLPDPLPAPRIQYADYAAWQERMLAGGVLEAQLAYWRAALDGAPALLELPADRPRPPVMSYQGASLPVRIDPALTSAVRALAHRHGATLFMTILAAWGVLMGRLSGQRDVVIGTPVANRQRAETEDLIGLFVNSLALRVTFEDDMDVATLLAQVRTTTLDGYAHQDAPFAQVVDALQPVRSQANSPLFQVMLAVNAIPGLDRLSLPGLDIAMLSLPKTTAQFDLSLSLDESGDVLAGELEYATDLFDAETAARLVGYLLRLLAAMAGDDTHCVGALPLLAQAERDRVLRDFNASDRAFPPSVAIHRLVERQAQVRPDAVAVEHEGVCLTYAQLDARANRLAHRLVKAGVRPDDRVAVCLERGAELCVALLAALKAGAGYVPLDAAYPRERLAFLLEDSAPVALLTRSGLPAAALASGGRCRVIDLAHDGADSAGAARMAPAVDVQSSHLAYVIYTSGSTGTPKGVMVEHGQLFNLVHWHQERFGITESARTSCVAGLGFDAAAWEIWPTLCAGATLVMPSAAQARDPAALVAWWSAATLDVSFLPTPLAEYAFSSGQANPGLRTLLVGGDRLRRRPAHALPFALVNNYGPTEATVVATSGTLDPAAQRLHIGRPIANSRVYILDPAGAPVPVGVAGELYIGGAGVARGYLNRPDLSAERFLADPFAAAQNARMYRTGDLGRWLADGSIDYVGRNDFQLKIRGFRIEPGEIENHLEGCAGVREALVVAREDEPGAPRLVAYVVPHAGCDVQPAQLRAGLAALPEYLLPAAFVVLEAFPLTPNGKIDRRALPAPALDAVAAGAYQAPEGEAESAVAAVFGEVLGLERVGRNDHFFALGGHSLLAVQVVARLREKMGIDLPLGELFSHPTVAGLARLAVQSGMAATDAIRRAARGDALPLSWQQQRLWLLTQLDPAIGAAYHIPAALRLTGRLDRAALQAALDGLLARHEALRTTFADHDGQPAQIIAPADTRFHLPCVDLRTLPELERQDETARLRAEEAGRPFDLARGPMVRGMLLQTAEEEHVLLITQHHIASDGWSVAVLVREVAALYASRGADVLPPLPLQYADYAAWQHSDAQKRRLDEQQRYWLRRLAGLPVQSAFPLDRPRSARQSHAGATHHMALDAGLADALKTLSQAHGATLYMTLAAAFSVLLGRLAGQDDVAFGSPVAGRTRRETEDLIGFFVNTLVIRADLAGNPTFLELLERMRATCVEAYANQELPFEQLVAALKPERTLAHSPLFQVTFTLQNNARPAIALDGLHLELLEPEMGASKFDLSLMMEETPDGLRADFSYNSDLFEAASIERIGRRYAELLRGIVRAPATALADLPLLDAQERRTLLEDFNDTAVQFPVGLCLHEAFTAQAMRTPAGVALRSMGGDTTYAELDEASAVLAHHLQAAGAGPGKLVGIHIPRDPAMVVAVLAVLKSGAAYVPLDPAYPQERLAWMAADSGADIVLTQQELAGALPFHARTVLALDALPRAPAAAAARIRDVMPDDLAYVTYTSGSTGQPKGVMTRHASALNYLQFVISRYGVRAGEQVLQIPTLSFDASVRDIFSTLLAGGTLHVMAPAQARDPAEVARLLRHWKITAVLSITPSFLESVCLAAGPAADEAGLRLVLASGEQLTDRHAERLATAFGAGAQLVNQYGPTECTMTSTYHVVRPGQPIAVGRPIANASVHVLDGRGRLAPIGSTGEIHIGGAGVSPGYLGRDDLTAERFAVHPELSGARLYRTGDLGRWRNDGALEYLGRADTQVKLRGIRVELGEIEQHLVRLAGVAEAAAVVREDTPGEQRLVAYVTSAASPAPAGTALRAELRKRLPEAMVPSAVVVLGALPLSPNGKLDRSALPAPERDSVVATEYEAPQGELEQRIADIWQGLLGADRVGRHDQFFDLGGHSLLAAQVAARLREAFAVEVPLATLFASPTVATQAEAVFAQRAQALESEEMDRLAAEIADLSEEELMQLLAEEDGLA